jgi:ATP-dependent Clp protease ATP-binding subunit ClpC
MFERFNEAARRALFFARYEASQLGSASIGIEHLLLGLAREPRGIVASLLTSSGTALNSLREAVQAECQFREKIATSVEIPFSKDTKQALEFTADEANRLRHSYIAPEHLLLGVLRVERSVAAGILTRHGLRLDAVREEVVRLSGESGGRPWAYHQTLEQIGRIKQLVSALAVMRADSPGRFELAQAIVVELDSLADGLAPPEASR